MQDIRFESRPATAQEHEQTALLLKRHSEAALGMNVDHAPFGLLAYEGDKMAGGIIGKIFLGWLHADLVWVDEAHRRRGIGTRLMRLAEEQAKAAGLSGIEVWTQSWQAPEFYRRLGYEEFAVIDDFLPGRKRHAFRKRL